MSEVETPVNESAPAVAPAEHVKRTRVKHSKYTQNLLIKVTPEQKAKVSVLGVAWGYGKRGMGKAMRKMIDAA